MNLHQTLCSSGMEQVVQSLAFRAGVLHRVGIEVDEVELLTNSERLNIQWIQSKLKANNLASASELAERDRLVVLLHRETRESQAWLQKLPLERLRKMMDAIESRW